MIDRIDGPPFDSIRHGQFRPSWLYERPVLFEFRARVDPVADEFDTIGIGNVVRDRRHACSVRAP